MTRSLGEVQSLAIKAARGAGYDFTIFRDRVLAIEHLHSAADRFDRRQRPDWKPD